MDIPQLDTKFFVSQIFWLTISFSILFFYLRRWGLPRVYKLLKLRNNIIDSMKKEVLSYEQKILAQKQFLQNEISIIEIASQSVVNKREEELRNELFNKKEQISKEIDEFIEKTDNAYVKLMSSEKTTKSKLNHFANIVLSRIDGLKNEKLAKEQLKDKKLKSLEEEENKLSIGFDFLENI